MESSWSVRCGLGAETVTGQGTRRGGCSTRGEDFYMATSEDIDVATREDFFRRSQLSQL